MTSKQFTTHSRLHSKNSHHCVLWLLIITGYLVSFYAEATPVQKQSKRIDLSDAAHQGTSNPIGYKVEFSKKSGRVSFCLDRGTLVTSSKRAYQYLTELSSALALHNNEMQITQPGCHWFKFTYAKPNSRYLSSKSEVSQVPTGVFLWSQPNHYRPFILHIAKAEGVNLAIPLESIDETRFISPSYPPFYSVQTYIGSFEQWWLTVPALNLQVNFLHDWSKGEKQAIKNWLSIVAKRSTKLFKDSSKTATLNLFSTRKNSQEAFPWAQVNRGEGTEIQFYLSQNFSNFSLTDDWTGYHELAHLALPFVSRDDAWLSEGFASYYQYLVQANRSIEGVLVALKRFRQGVRRGESQNHFKGQPLHLLSRKLSATGSYRRVYWHGALFWFRVDLELRKQNTNLVELIKHFNDCCRSQRGVWSGEALATQLDKLIEITFIAKWYQDTKNEIEYPNVNALFTQVGISFSPELRPLIKSTEKLNQYLKNLW